MSVLQVADQTRKRKRLLQLHLDYMAKSMTQMAEIIINGLMFIQIGEEGKMIILDVDAYCASCGEFEPDIEKLLLEEPMRDIYETFIRCKHRQKCRELIEYLREEDGDVKNG